MLKIHSLLLRYICWSLLILMYSFSFFMCSYTSFIHLRLYVSEGFEIEISLPGQSNHGNEA